MHRVWLTLCLAAAGVLVPSCGDDTDKGFPPSITNLTFSPATGTVGANITVTGSVSFTDREGDVESFAAAVSGPPGSTNVEPTAVNTGDETSGTIGFALIIVASQAGTYAFQVWLLDEQGNRSNTLAGEIEVNSP